MKKIMMGLAAVFVVIVLGLFFTGKDMRVVTTQIDIEASPDQVWNKLVDIDRWKEWSPIIKDSQGKASQGAKLVMTMISEEGKEGKPGPRYEPIITIFEPSKNLTWTAQMGASFIMTNGKVLELQEIAGGTRLIHQETFRGIMVPLMWKKVQANVPKMLDSMNEALKRLVEESK